MGADRFVEGGSRASRGFLRMVRAIFTWYEYFQRKLPEPAAVIDSSGPLTLLATGPAHLIYGNGSHGDFPIAMAIIVDMPLLAGGSSRG